jgi:hypothetical protein
MSDQVFAKQAAALERSLESMRRARSAGDVAARALAILAAWDKEGDPQQWDEFRIKLAADVAVQIERAAYEAVEKATSK